MLNEPSIPVSAIRSALAIVKNSERRAKRKIKVNDLYTNSYFSQLEFSQNLLLDTLEEITGTPIRRRPRHGKHA